MQRTGSEKPTAGARPQNEASPLLRLARRIREEQGVEQVKAFLAAMMPFAAPNELRHISEGFGIPFERIEAKSRESASGSRDGNRPQGGAPRPAANAGSPMGQGGDRAVNMLRTLMQLKGVMNAAPDPKMLMELMGKNMR